MRGIKGRPLQAGGGRWSVTAAPWATATIQRRGRVAAAGRDREERMAAAGRERGERLATGCNCETGENPRGGLNRTFAAKFGDKY